MADHIHSLVLAELRKAAAAVDVKLEKTRALQRQTPNMITHNTRQVALQRVAKELLAQSASWSQVLSWAATNGPEPEAQTLAGWTGEVQGPDVSGGDVKPAPERIVAWRADDGLYCNRRCRSFMDIRPLRAIRADELVDGAICTRCRKDVLA